MQNPITQYMVGLLGIVALAMAALIAGAWAYKTKRIELDALERRDNRTAQNEFHENLLTDMRDLRETIKDLREELDLKAALNKRLSEQVEQLTAEVHSLREELKKYRPDSK